MNKVALVTGASKGLGVEIVKALIGDGYKVVMTSSSRKGVDLVAGELGLEYDKYRTLALDVRDKSDFENALSFCIEEFGSCELLVNNAAITPTTDVMEITPEEFSEVVDTNLRGTFLGCQVFGKYLAGKNYGRIVNISSLAGQMGGTASGAHYAASKAGIITLTKIFARKLAPLGVTVNSIAPGPIDVPSMSEKLSAQQLEDIVNNAIPVRALSSAKYIADMVVMLARKDAETVTGATWDINGGIYMR